MSNEAKLAFTRVKPFCVKVSQQRNISSVQQLCNVIKQLPSDVVQELHEYLLFPLRVIFLEKNNAKEDVIVACADAIQCVLRKSKVKEWKTFEDLCHVLLLPITSFNNAQILSSGTEDKKLGILNAVLALLNSSLSEHCELFYHVNHYPFIGHIISICLEIISNEKNKELRKIAVSVIKSLCITSNVIDTADNKLTQVSISDCLASFLPGIVSGLLKVVSGDANQGQAVKCHALATICELLKTTAGDDNIKLNSDSAISSGVSEKKIDPKLSNLKVKRDSLWLKLLSSKVEVIMQHVMTASDHLNVNVRVAVVEFAQNMLQSCSKFLFKSHLGSLLKIPCKLLHDEIEAVALKCEQVIQDFSSQNKNNSSVTDILQEELFNLCTALPKVLSKGSDHEKESSLNLVLGIIEVLKYNLHHVMCSSTHVNTLLKSIIFCFQMDCSELYKIEEVSSTSINFDKEIKTFFKGQSKNWFFKKSFLHFHNENICQTLIKLCRLIGKYGDIDVLIDYLKERYESENQCRSVVVVINEVLLGAMDNPDHIIYPHIDHLLDVYTSNENWYLCTSYDSLYVFNQPDEKKQNTLAIANSSSNLSLKTINANIVLVCLHLEALATFSIVLSKDFRGTLIKSLYPLLEKVNDNNHLIRSCALKALDVIAVSCQYKDIAELVNENADYLVSTISVHLRHLGLFPRSPAVLQAMLTHCNVTVFPLIRDTVDEVLFTIDLHRLEGRFLLSFLPVLMATVKIVSSWFSKELSESSHNDDKNNSSESPCDSDSIISHLVDIHTNFKIATLDATECDTEESHSSLPENVSIPQAQRDLDDDSAKRVNDVEFDDKKETPSHVKIVEEIMHRSSNLLANVNPKVRLLVMDIIDQGVFCLRKENDVLLPLVHKLWSPLTMRCMDTELQIVAKAFNVISNIGNYSGTFMRRRFTKDVLPKLLSFLKKHAQPNLSKVSTHTTLFKLQVTVLNRLGGLLLCANVSYKDLNAVCVACQSYLSSRQHQELQTAALCLFKFLIQLDPDAVWLFLSDIFSVTSHYHSASFKDVTVSGTNDCKSEYAANVTHLLSLCP